MLWVVMEADGFPPKLLRLVQAHYLLTKSRVRARGGASALLEVPTGVWQGSPLSPTLFTFVVAWILRNALSAAPGVQLGSPFGLTDLAYVGNIALLDDSFAAVQAAVNHRFAAVVSLRIYASKTKVPSAHVDPTLHQGIYGAGEPLEVSAF